MKLRKFAAVILAVLLTLTLCVAPVFADEDTSASADAAEAATTEEAVAENADDAELAVTADEGDTEGAVTATGSEETETNETETEKEINWDGIIAGGIVLVALIVLAVLYFVNAKFKERVNKFAKDYISELKKVVWSPLRDVKKNTVVVIVLSLFFAIMIGLLDVIFSEGIQALGPVVSSLLK